MGVRLRGRQVKRVVNGCAKEFSQQVRAKWDSHWREDLGSWVLPWAQHQQDKMRTPTESTMNDLFAPKASSTSAFKIKACSLYIRCQEGRYQLLALSCTILHRFWYIHWQSPDDAFNSQPVAFPFSHVCVWSPTRPCLVSLVMFSICNVVRRPRQLRHVVRNVHSNIAISSTMWQWSFICLLVSVVKHEDASAPQRKVEWNPFFRISRRRHVGYGIKTIQTKHHPTEPMMSCANMLPRATFPQCELRAFCSFQILNVLDSGDFNANQHHAGPPLWGAFVHAWMQFVACRITPFVWRSRWHWSVLFLYECYNAVVGKC